MEVETVDVTDIPTKKCSRCNAIKNTCDFYKDKYAKDGYKNKCKQCHDMIAAQSKAKKKAASVPKPRKPLIVDGRKLCPGCKITKPVCDYAKDSSSRFGFQTRCKSCQGILSKQTKNRNRLHWQTTACTTSGPRKCTICHETKDTAEFRRDNSRKDGYGSHCKPCGAVLAEKSRDKRRERWANNEVDRQGDKKCWKCGLTHSKTSFQLDSTQADGLSGKCKTCVKEQKSNGREIVRDWIKKNGPCQHCGEDDIDCLELDHIDPSEKDFAVSQILHYKRDTILEELTKVRVLCCFCHRIVTHQQRQMIKTGKSNATRIANQQINIAMKNKVGKCAKCDRALDQTDSKQYCAFDWDHLDPSTKTDDIASMVKGGYTTDQIRDEIAKCQLLCANCHTKRTKQQRKDGLINNRK
uniref:Restriction endonuclease HNH n=1 Tax=Clandestinovirus TaxID=2831644 RepID=A0A8F8KPY6_9VIRU|nr:restriction endonuclease HNH [Clandestinovirus]